MLDLDLRLLAIFEEIYKVKSVSVAAENLRIAQPTVSMGLRRLRDRFNDPLFVRTSTGMEPTPRAMELWQPLTQAHAMVEDALRHKVTFDPVQTARCFRVCMTDVSQVVLLPAMLNHLNKVAPSMRIEVIPVAADTSKLLESADADLSIGFVSPGEAGFVEQTLFSETFVCVARKGHPRIGKTLTLKNYKEEAHVEVLSPGTGHWIVEKVLESHKIHPEIALKVPSYLGISAVVATSDVICTVPHYLAQALATTSAVRTFRPPIEFPAYTIKQHWHERFHRDARNKWLREMVASLFLEKGGKKSRKQRQLPTSIETGQVA